MNTINSGNSYNIVDFMRLFFLIPREELIPFIEDNDILFQEKINLAFMRTYKILSEKWWQKVRTQNKNPKRIMPNGSTYEDVLTWLEILQLTIFSQKTGKIIDNIPRVSKFTLKKSYQISEAMKYIRNNWALFHDSLIEVTNPDYQQDDLINWNI